MKKGFFIVGGPGSGKDVVIKHITTRYGISEYTYEQIQKLLDTSGLPETFIVKGNAYSDNILSIKECLETNNVSLAMIFVDVSDTVSKSRLQSRSINESVRLDRYQQSKYNSQTFPLLFNNYVLFENNNALNDTNFNAIDMFIKKVLFPVNYMTEKHIQKAKTFVYKKFMLDKNITKAKNKPSSFYSTSPLKPDGYNEYDIRMSGQSNVVNYSEDIGSPETLNTLTGMSYSNRDDGETSNYDTPVIKKSKLSPRFNSPAKQANTKVWHRTKAIIFRKSNES